MRRIASPQAALKGNIMRGGVTAIICIVGVSCLGSSFFEGKYLLNHRFMRPGLVTMTTAMLIAWVLS